MDKIIRSLKGLKVNEELNRTLLIAFFISICLIIIFVIFFGFTPRSFISMIFLPLTTILVISNWKYNKKMNVRINKINSMLLKDQTTGYKLVGAYYKEVKKEMAAMNGDFGLFEKIKTYLSKGQKMSEQKHRVAILEKCKLSLFSLENN